MNTLIYSYQIGLLRKVKVVESGCLNTRKRSAQSTITAMFAVKKQVEIDKTNDFPKSNVVSELPDELKLGATSAPTLDPMDPYSFRDGKITDYQKNLFLTLQESKLDLVYPKSKGRRYHSEWEKTILGLDILKSSTKRFVKCAHSSTTKEAIPSVTQGFVTGKTPLE